MHSHCASLFTLWQRRSNCTGIVLTNQVSPVISSALQIFDNSCQSLQATLLPADPNNTKHTMSRAMKELRGLMPFAWDSRVGEHPVGSAAMRDFQDAFGWSGRSPRTPGASSSRKRSAPVLDPSPLPPLSPNPSFTYYRPGYYHKGDAPRHKKLLHSTIEFKNPRANAGYMFGRIPREARGSSSGLSLS